VKRAASTMDYQSLLARFRLRYGPYPSQAVALEVARRLGVKARVSTAVVELPHPPNMDANAREILRLHDALQRALLFGISPADIRRLVSSLPRTRGIKSYGSLRGHRPLLRKMYRALIADRYKPVNALATMSQDTGIPESTIRSHVGPLRRPRFR
jgi:hypothetical protein